MLLHQTVDPLEGMRQPDPSTQEPDPRRRAASRSWAELERAAVWRALWRGKWVLLALVVLCTVGAIAVSFSLTPIYRADIVLAPVGQERSRATAGLSFGSSLQNLARGSGIAPWGGNAEIFAAVAELKSRAITTEFITEQKLLTVLFQHRWDSSQQVWLPDEPGFGRRITQSIGRAFDKFFGTNENAYSRSGQDTQPSSLQAYEAFNQLRRVSVDLDAQLVTVSIEMRDPELAAITAQKLIESYNVRASRKAIERAEKRIDYLDQLLTTTQTNELRQQIIELKKREISAIMVANVHEDYVFKVIDPPITPEQPTRPRRGLLAILGVAIGIFIGGIISFALFLGRERRRLYDD